MAGRFAQRFVRPGLGAPPEDACRVLMATGGLIALQLDPLDFAVVPEATSAMLLAYVAFAVWILARSMRGGPQLRGSANLDLCWCLALTAVTGGTSSPLFFFLLQPIMSRSFRGGFEAGWTMTWMTTAGFLLVGLPSSPGGILFEFNRAMIRPLTLLILGYMLAREGGVQKRAQRQLALLAQINTIANPRFGIDRTLSNAAARIRESYDIAECVIVLRREEGEPCLIARAGTGGSTIEPLPAAAAAPLLALPPDALVLHSPRTRLCVGAAAHEIVDQCQGLGDVLDAVAYVTAPMSRGDTTVGRIFVLNPQLSQFDGPELKFLAEVGRHLLHIVEKVELLDRYASFAAERERRRLAHDLHDVAIQPYLGLQIGIEAALRRPYHCDAARDDLRGLLKLAHQSADELRRLLAGEKAASGGEDVIAESLARLAKRYRDHFDIAFAYDCAAGLRVSDRLAADLVAMIGEGLSNIRRHTASREARLRLYHDGDELRLSLANERGAGCDDGFVPKSIRERARALGGDARVDHSDPRKTIVRVRIPL